MKEAMVTWVDGMQFVSESGNGHALVIDANAEGGGRGTGPSPMDLLLMGVVGCTAMDVVSVLKKKRQDLRGLKILAQAEQAGEDPHRFTHINLEYVASGHVELAALERSIQLSEEKYCSAMATFRPGVEFTHTSRVEAIAEPVAGPVA
jgi:putative redox protein